MTSLGHNELIRLLHHFLKFQSSYLWTQQLLVRFLSFQIVLRSASFHQCACASIGWCCWSFIIVLYFMCIYAYVFTSVAFRFYVSMQSAVGCVWFTFTVFLWFYFLSSIGQQWWNKEDHTSNMVYFVGLGMLNTWWCKRPIIVIYSTECVGIVMYSQQYTQLKQGHNLFISSSMTKAIYRCTWWNRDLLARMWWKILCTLIRTIWSALFKRL